MFPSIVTFCLETKSNQKVQEILILLHTDPRRPGKISSSPQVFQFEIFLKYKIPD
jgi:hypothetical protein